MNFKRRVALTFLALQVLASCSASDYSEGENDQDAAQATETDETPTQRVLIESMDEGPLEVDFDSGTPLCLESSTDLTVEIPYTPRSLDESMLLSSASTFESVPEWTDAFDALLRTVVEANTGLVDYEALSGDHAEHFLNLLEGLSSHELPSPSAKQDWLAYWVNVYNAVMLGEVTKRSSLVKIEGEETFQELFESRVTNVGGHSLSLNEIEYCITKLSGSCPDDFSEELKSQVDSFPYEPKLHVAYNCAAKSCPRLRNFAYRPENLDRVVEENLYLFLNSEQHFQLEPLKVSTLLNWFSNDFDALATSQQEPLPHRYLKDTCRTGAEQFRSAFDAVDTVGNLSFLDYDWTVNRK